MGLLPVKPQFLKNVFCLPFSDCSAGGPPIYFAAAGPFCSPAAILALFIKHNLARKGVAAAHNTEHVNAVCQVRPVDGEIMHALGKTAVI